MYKNFQNYINGIINLNGGSIESTIKSLTNKLISLKNKPNNLEILKISPNYNNIEKGQFYLIQYDFNGNYIWCPILSLEKKIHKNNQLLYCLNLEYLPPKYKIMFFNKIFKQVYTTMEKISNDIVVKQNSLNFLSFEFIYKMLKNNGNMNYAIGAYTIKNFNNNVKIKKIYKISINILPEIILSDFKNYNSKNMNELHNKLPNDSKIKLKTIIKEYNELIQNYQSDSIQYHKNVALFRERLKLY